MLCSDFVSCQSIIFEIQHGIGLHFFFKQKTTYEMRISDWSSDVCSSDHSYTQALSLREQQRIAELNLTNAQSVLDLVQTRYDAGSATALELSQQKSLEIGRASCRERVCQDVSS